MSYHSLPQELGATFTHIRCYFFICFQVTVYPPTSQSLTSQTLPTHIRKLRIFSILKYQIYYVLLKHSTCLKLCCYFKYIRSLFLVCHWQGFWVLFPSHEPRGFYCMSSQSIRFLGTCILCHSRTDRRSVCVGYYSCVYFLALLKRQTMTPQKQWAHLAPRSEILKVIFQ